MSSHRLATIVANLRPADLTGEEGIAYDTANALLGGGVLSPVIWESALAAFGKEGAVPLERDETFPAGSTPQDPTPR
jgi:4-carboxymuconolactone decarboxylase